MAIGLLVVAAVTAFDVANRHAVVIGIVVLAPFLTARLGTPGQTTAIAAIAGVVAAASFTWNSDGLDAPFFVRLLVVAVAGVVATLAARERLKNELAVRRFSLLAQVAQVTNGRRSVREVADRIGQMVVPAMADYVLIDLRADGRIQRLLVRLDGPDAEDLEAYMLDRAPAPETAGVGSAAVAVAGAPVLLDLTDEILAQSSTSEHDLAMIKRLDLRTIATAPLIARGSMIGALTVGVRRGSGRKITAEGLAFHEVLAGRVALALDNAGLDSELREAERQLGTALGQLDQAVIITDGAGDISYVNERALDLLGVADRASLSTRSGADVLSSLVLCAGDSGRRLDEHELPWGRPLRDAATGPLLVRRAGGETDAMRWLMLKASPIIDEAGAAAHLVTTFEDVTEIKRAELGAQILADASAAMAAAGDPEVLLERVVHAVVPGLGQWCAVAVADDWGRLQNVVACGADGGPSEAAVLRSSDPFGVHRALETRQAVLTQGAPGVVLAVPLIAGESALGALAIGMESPLTDEGRALLLELGRRAGAALAHSRLALERAVTNAALQRGLRPSELPAVPGWALAAEYRPAGRRNFVGGDFYDVFPTPQGWMALVGDVTGHGPQAARLTAVSRFAFRAVAELSGDPMAAVERLNATLCAEPELALVTVVCLRLGEIQADGTVTVDVVRCGHPPPLLLRGGEITELGAVGPLLGALSEGPWAMTTVSVAPGDRLLVYTDGVPDLAGQRGRIGMDGLKNALTSSIAGGGSAAEVLAATAQTLDEWRGGPQRDDEAMLLLERCT